MEEGVGDLTGDHVDLVARGNRDEHVGVFRASAPQNVGMRCPAVHCLDIEFVAQRVERCGVTVDQRDIERQRMARERMGEIHGDVHVILADRNDPAGVALAVVSDNVDLTAHGWLALAEDVDRHHLNGFGDVHAVGVLRRDRYRCRLSDLKSDPCLLEERAHIPGAEKHPEFAELPEFPPKL